MQSHYTDHSVVSSFIGLIQFESDLVKIVVDAQLWSKGLNVRKMCWCLDVWDFGHPGWQQGHRALGLTRGYWRFSAKPPHIPLKGIIHESFPPPPPPSLRRLTKGFTKFPKGFTREGGIVRVWWKQKIRLLTFTLRCFLVWKTPSGPDLGAAFSSSLTPKRQIDTHISQDLHSLQSCVCLLYWCWIFFF